MKLLLKNVTITDTSSPHHGQTTDILVEDARIRQIATGISDSEAQVIEAGNLHVSPGWVDMCASFRDPGYEHKETLQTGARAAVAGGFTDVVLMPDTQPVVSGKTQVEYIVNRSRSLPVNLHPCGSLSNAFDGENLSEMYDMQQAGAVAFTDNRHYVKAGLLSRALLYGRNVDALIMTFPHDPSLAPGGMMSEGVQSTLLGLKGIPAIAEEVPVMRDIFLAGYHKAPLHFMALSSSQSVARVAEAKQKGIPVTAQVAAWQLYFTDSDLQEFDTNLKLSPPLRTQEENRALCEALKEGIIDCICSAHSPEDPESKKVEFDHAEFGMIALETAFAAANYVLGDTLGLAALIEKFTVNPRRILRLPAISIAEGNEAVMTLFDPDAEWTYTEKDIRSRSRNTPFPGRPLRGKVYGIVQKGNYFPA